MQPLLNDHIATSEQLCADVTLISDTHRLSQAERLQLTRMIVGAIPGNRDLPIFLLAAKICEADIHDLFDLIIPGQTALARLEAAFADFVITVATIDASTVEKLLIEFDAARQNDDPVRAVSGALSRVLHGYRVHVLPETRHHNVFTAIRRFYAHHRPQDPTPRDGDAIVFWEAEGTRSFLTRFVTALKSIVDYADAARLAATWRHGVALDDIDAQELPQDAGAEMAEDDPIAPERLESSIAAVTGTPLKLLLSSEIDKLRALASIAGAARRWPSDTMSALCFSPVQSMITEAMRRDHTALDVSAYLYRAENYTDVRAFYDLLNDKLLDALHLIHLDGLPEPEMVSARSSMTGERRKRIKAMERRRSFVRMDESVFPAALLNLVEPLITLRMLVEAVCTPWNKFSSDYLGNLQHEHEARFRGKFEQLYAPQRGGDLG
jgi:hypothetical protein